MWLSPGELALLTAIAGVGGFSLALTPLPWPATFVPAFLLGVICWLAARGGVHHPRLAVAASIAAVGIAVLCVLAGRVWASRGPNRP